MTFSIVNIISRASLLSRALRRRHVIRQGIIGLVLSLLLPASVSAGQAYYILDARTGKALAAHNADVRNHPASLTKMMTLYLTFEALHRGRIKWSSRVTFSRHAASISPTKLWVKAGSSITVREAVLGMIVPSANDAASAMAEKLGGSEAKFARLMTAKARALGMSNTVFYNASGLPNRKQVTTARDMSTLAVALMNDFPAEYRLFSTRSFRFHGRRVRGHNNLMYRYKGMDGFKTGFTNASGFNLVSAVKRGDRRVIGVVMGGATARSRDKHMARLLDKAIPKAKDRSGARLYASVPRATGIVKTDPLPLPSSRRQESAKLASASASAANLITAASTETKPIRYWMIQVGTSSTASGARSLLEEIMKDHAATLNHAYPFVGSLRAGNATVYRSRYTGFRTRDDAAQVCRRLKRQAVKCFVPARGPL